MAEKIFTGFRKRPFRIKFSPPQKLMRKRDTGIKTTNYSKCNASIGFNADAFLAG